MDMTKELVIDIILAINIVFKCFTTHMKDGQWETRLRLIIKKYATSAEMYIDMLGCLPTMFTLNKANEQYPFKLFRFFYIVEVFETISDFVKFFLLKLGLNKGNINKIQRLCLLFIICFQLIHVLGCTWIFIAKTQDCSWIEQGNPNLILSETILSDEELSLLDDPEGGETI